MGSDALAATALRSEHLVALPGSDWAVWAQALLRAPGMPAEWADDLTTPELTAALDEVVTAHEALDVEAEQLVADLLAGPLLSPAGRRALKAIRARRVPAKGLGDEWRPRLDRLATLVFEAEQTRRRFGAVFATEAMTIGRQLEKRAAEPLFRAAVTWQNPELAERLAMVRDPTVRKAADRKRLGIIARYLQRYTLKNDSIGFFGPLSWCPIDPALPELVESEPGALIAERTTYFEQWCIDEVCRLIERSADARQWLPPRRRPTVAVGIGEDGLRVDGELVAMPADRLTVIKDVLALCDGTRTREAIAAELPSSSPAKSSEVLAKVLDAMERARLITTRLELPVDAHPERVLRDVLNRFAPPEQLADLLSLVGTLEAARSRIDAAAGEPDRLREETRALSQWFTQVSGTGSTRSHGATYAGRTLLYVDCGRGGTNVLGADFLHDYGPPLSLILDSSRWLAAECGRLLNDAFTTLYRKLAATHPVVDIALFWDRLAPVIFGDDRAIVAAATQELQRRWTAVLADVPEDRAVVFFRSEDLREVVNRLFDAPAAGWRTARYHSPDVMVGVSPEGPYAVLGEAHVGSNTARNNVFVLRNADPQWCHDCYEADIQETTVRPIMPRHFLSSPRLAPVLESSRTRLLLLSDDSSWLLADPRAVAAADAVVEIGPGGPQMRLPDGECVHLLDVFAEAISYLVTPSFKLLPERSHLPRVVIDNLVVSRERWNVVAADLTAALVKDEVERMVEMARWRVGLGLPRRVFVRSSTESKPVYIDFASPELVSLLARIARASADVGGQLNITEVLPAPTDGWLTDLEGRTYTSEFRLIAVDQRPDRHSRLRGDAL